MTNTLSKIWRSLEAVIDEIHEVLQGKKNSNNCSNNLGEYTGYKEIIFE